MKQGICLGLTCVAVTALLSACSSLPSCKGTQPYMLAKQYPPLTNPPGLSVPAPDPDNAIPDVEDGPVGHYDNRPGDASDKTFAECLFAPPPMPTTGD